ELPDGVNAQQLAADSSRRDTDVAAARVFNPIQQEKIVGRPPPGHSEIGTFTGAHRRPGLEVVEDGPGIESNQIVETTAVERQVFDCSLPTSPETDAVVVLTSGASPVTVTSS